MEKIQFLYVTVALFITLLCACSSDESLVEASSQSSFVESPFLVAIDEALDNADKMFALIGPPNTRSEREVVSVERLCKSTRSAYPNDLTNGFYVVNYANDRGFAILSADRRIAPIFALSEEGSLHMEDTIRNMGLNWYINELMPELAKSSIKNPIDTTSYPFHPIDIPWSYYEKYSDPLLSGVLSKLHQEYPYNIYLNYQLVGCGPLAVGTIMGYYEWPSTSEDYTFNWPLMKLDANNSGWARLFEILGRKEYLNVYPTPNSTLTFMSQECMARTFSKMGYTGTKVTDFSLASIEKALKKNHPVIIDGSPNTMSNGHIWVIDGGYTTGYEENQVSPNMEPRKIFLSYFHCVWGESGKGNGYYLYHDSSIGGSGDKSDSEASCEVPIYKNLRICYGYLPVK